MLSFLFSFLFASCFASSGSCNQLLNQRNFIIRPSTTKVHHVDKVKDERLRTPIEKNIKEIQSVLSQHFKGLKGQIVSDSNKKVRESQIIINRLLDEQERLQRYNSRKVLIDTTRNAKVSLDDSKHFNKKNQAIETFEKMTNDAKKKIDTLNKRNAEFRRQDIMNPSLQNEILEFKNKSHQFFEVQTNELTQHLRKTFEDLKSIKRTFFNCFKSISQHFTSFNLREFEKEIENQLLDTSNETQIEQDLKRFNEKSINDSMSMSSIKRQTNKILNSIESESKRFNFLIVKTQNTLKDAISEEGDRQIQITKRFSDYLFGVKQRSDKIFTEVQSQLNNFF
jgi:hypothetical protein